VTDIDIDERIEAILGPELTRKLDAYIAQEAEEGLLYQHRPPTRLEVVSRGVEAVISIAQMTRGAMAKSAGAGARSSEDCQAGSQADGQANCPMTNRVRISNTRPRKDRPIKVSCLGTNPVGVASHPHRSESDGLGHHVTSQPSGVG
jgi:hypothetical protein